MLDNPFVLSNIMYKNIPYQFLTHKEDKVIGNCLSLGILHDVHILNYLSSVLKPGDHVLDAGANIGVISIILAKFQPSATIYCFEPDPLNYSLLNINIALNDIHNIFTFNYALGKEQKFITFYKNNMNYGDHRTSKPLSTDGDAGSFYSLPIQIHSVQIVEFLKQCLGENSPHFFDIIKIDTQGDDFEILESCLPIIDNHSTVVLEYSPHHLIRNGTSKDNIQTILNHFSGFYMLPDHINIVKINEDKIVSDYDSLIQTGRFYDIVLNRKK